MPWASIPPISWREENVRRGRWLGVNDMVFDVVAEPVRRRSSESISGTLTISSLLDGMTGVAKARTGFRGAFAGGDSKMSPPGVLPTWKGEDLNSKSQQTPPKYRDKGALPSVAVRSGRRSARSNAHMTDLFGDGGESCRC